VQAELGHRLSSADRADLLLIRPPALTVSRLAPYKGWEYLFEKAQGSWEELRQVVSKPVVKRIGVRFINRIDAPSTDGAPRLVNIYPSIPRLSDFPLKQFIVQVTQKIDQELQATISSLPVESPVPDRVSYLLDIDVSSDENIPRRDDEMWSLLGRMRSAKNNIFETLITSTAREIFEK